MVWKPNLERWQVRLPYFPLSVVTLGHLFTHVPLSTNSLIVKSEVDSFPSHMSSQGSADLHFYSPQTDISLYCEAADMGLVYRAACLFTPPLLPVPNYTAWWQRHTGVSSLPKATEQWCLGTTQTMHQKSDGLPIAPPCHLKQHNSLGLMR